MKLITALALFAVLCVSCASFHSPPECDERELSSEELVQCKDKQKPYEFEPSYMKGGGKR